jgi:hypothetical protein
MEITDNNEYDVLHIDILSASGFKITYMKNMSVNQLYESTIDLRVPIFSQIWVGRLTLQSYVCFPAIQFILQGKTQQTLSTLRYKTFAIGAYFEKVQNQYVLKLALNLKRREWFSGLWKQAKSFELPFIHSIA